MMSHFVPATNADDAGSDGRSARTDSIGGSSELDTIFDESWRHLAEGSVDALEHPSFGLDSRYN